MALAVYLWETIGQTSAFCTVGSIVTESPVRSWPQCSHRWWEKYISVSGIVRVTISGNELSEHEQLLATHSLRWAVISEHKVMVGWGRRADEHWGVVRHQDVSVWLGYGWDLPLIWVNYYGECWTCELTVIIITGIEKSIFSNTDRMFLIEILQAIVNQTIRIHFQQGITPMNAMIPPTITSFGSSSQWKRS